MHLLIVFWNWICTVLSSYFGLLDRASVLYHCVILYEVELFGYFSLFLASFALLVCNFLRGPQTVFLFGIIWIYCSCVIKLLSLWPLVL